MYDEDDKEPLSKKLDKAPRGTSGFPNLTLYRLKLSDWSLGPTITEYMQRLCEEESARPLPVRVKRRRETNAN